jgi:hypothetical protein
MVSRVADRSEQTRRPVRVPLQSRNRKRWLAAAGVGVLWILFMYEAHSLLAGTILLLFLAAGVAGLIAALRMLGVNRDHPWVQRLATRPWRDGRDVLRVALRHLSEAFLVTPSGSLLAPNMVELRMNPGDLASLTEFMEITLVDASAMEAYEGEIAAHGATLATPGPVQVSVSADESVPPGRYRLKQGRPLSPPAEPWPAVPVPAPVLAQPVPVPAQPALAQPALAHPVLASPVLASPVLAGPAPVLSPPRPAPAIPADPAWAGTDWPEPPWPASWGQPGAPAPAAGGVTTATIAAEPVTMAAPSAIPVLRLVTGDQVCQTRTSGARAGRGAHADLVLPEELTVSRVHAQFTYREGWWRVTSLGRNGIALGGLPVTGEHVLHDGDSIGWGTHPGALTSRVEIGWDRSAAR